MKNATSEPAREHDAASALAMSVLPVPGAPYNSTPLGGDILKRAKTSGYKSGKNTISLSESTYLSNPPTASNDSVGSTAIGVISALTSPPPFGAAEGPAPPAPPASGYGGGALNAASNAPAPKLKSPSSESSESSIHRPDD